MWITGMLALLAEFFPWGRAARHGVLRRAYPLGQYTSLVGAHGWGPALSRYIVFYVGGF